MAFKKGHKLAPGGARPGSGRSPDWLKAHTRDIIAKDKLVERLAIIARGGFIDQPLSNGEIIPLPAPVAEQRKAILDLLDRGYGKPGQPLDVTVNKSELAPIPTQDLREIFAAFAGGTTGPVEARD